MKIFLIILSLLAAIIIQTTLFSVLAKGGVSPDLVLALILFLVILYNFRKVWWLVVLAGLILDFFSGLPFGLMSLSLLGASFLIDWLNRNIFSTVKFWIIALLTVLGTWLYNLFFLVLNRLFQINLSYPLRNWLIEAFYNLLLVSIFYGAKKIFRKKQGR